MMPISIVPSQMRRLGLALMLPAVLVSTLVVAIPWQSARGQTGQAGQTGQTDQTGGGGPLTLRSDTQEANSQTGVLTARGNVQIYYPSRQIQATAAQAQYFSRERRIVLSGNVYILQHGNSIRGETVTYLIDQGQFIVMPKASQQVESIYIVADPNNSSNQSSTAPATPPLNPKPASKK
ncbi:MAG: hypothetical protein JO235_28715 [Chroococcidiopsidaceae cyanobacterium CP_BM_RX_35]|nr:hypothetical protein [Chroococcidiopsidaceae cyanobacterium CP_BM_RX_35]